MPFNCLKIHIWAYKDFWFWVYFKFLDGFLGFLRSWMSLSKYQENFLGVLGKKRLENRFL
jgi:hypothetical protein